MKKVAGFRGGEGLNAEKGVGLQEWEGWYCVGPLSWKRKNKGEDFGYRLIK